MIESYQEEKALEAEEPQDAVFATVGTIYDDGMTLVWDESGAESQKHYKCNSFAVFHEGERVRLVKDGGTYVVEYAVGTPKKSFRADTAGSAASAARASAADRATSAATADNALKLNGKAESALSVASAARATSAATADKFTDRHTGSQLGFFGVAAKSRRAVSALSSAEPENIRLRLNSLIAALKEYGLIS